MEKIVINYLANKPILLWLIKWKLSLPNKVCDKKKKNQAFKSYPFFSLLLKHQAQFAADNILSFFFIFHRK